ncbi:molybdenum cofactor cytidylyltransferase [Halohasta litchfieldiae]|jgi:molybdenum cofactor cytidylyltransferase|nr:nucleotidyltransferase family protein [Halohasta litchfieldiae]ATW89366.1 molybdenum cofactor cytidylyltransferase [Halohasta litchfieldiae]
MAVKEFPVVEPPFEELDGGVAGGQSTVVGVVLAAGTSSRFGATNKLLAEWADAPLVSHVVDTLLRSTVDKVVVVVGDDAGRVRRAVSDFEVTIVHNDRYASGQSTSVRRGITAARNHGADAVVFALGDMPTVEAESFDLLVAAYRTGVSEALAAACNGARGNPVLFGRRHFEALADATGDTGGREILLDDDRAVLVETGDRGVLVDVDSPDDMSTLRLSS